VKNNLKQKGLGVWLKLLEHLPSDCKALSSNCSMKKKKGFRTVGVTVDICTDMGDLLSPCTFADRCTDPL
jgi:hypothetical protein